MDPKDPKKELATQMRDMLVSVTNACPELLPPGDGDALTLVQDAVGEAIKFASKWHRDIDAAMAANQGNASVLVAAEILAYGALASMYAHNPEADLRRRLYAAGRIVGDFIVERWRSQTVGGVRS